MELRAHRRIKVGCYGERSTGCSACTLNLHALLRCFMRTLHPPPFFSISPMYILHVCPPTSLQYCYWCSCNLLSFNLACSSVPSRQAPWTPLRLQPLERRAKSLLNLRRGYKATGQKGCGTGAVQRDDTEPHSAADVPRQYCQRHSCNKTKLIDGMDQQPSTETVDTLTQECLNQLKEHQAFCHSYSYRNII